MTCQDFVARIGERLSQPLPGAIAHERMSSEVRKKAGLAIRSDARSSAVLLLLSPDQKSFSFPLILRPEYDGVHSGQVALPGGKVEEQDISLVHTALREVKEEIGVLLDQSTVLGTLSTLYIPPSNMLVTPVVAFSERKQHYLPDAREVVQVFDVPLVLIQDESNIGLQVIPTGPGLEVKTPTYDIFGQTVWGATAMILSEFLYIYDEIAKKNE